MTERPEAPAGADPVPAAGPGSAIPDSSELLSLIGRLEDLLERSDLVELEVQAGDVGIMLRKPGPALWGAAPGGQPGEAGAAPAEAGQDAAGHRAHEPEAPALHAVMAPLTGIFYGSPSPGAAAYVRAGQEIVSGQVIGLIEAMKLFNEIKSDAAGRVVRIHAEDGKLVRAKQPLIEIEPT